MPLRIRRLNIPDIILIELSPTEDIRGSIFETFKIVDFEKTRLPTTFVEEIVSRSKQGVIRGLHYQLMPYAQGKLVRLSKGKIFDVALDMRIGSPSYGKAAEILLSESDMVWIPPGFAHGFAALEDSEVVYKFTDNGYAPKSQRGIIWNDPDIGIGWPLKNPILSHKDTHLPRLKEAENNYRYTRLSPGKGIVPQNPAGDSSLRHNIRKVHRC